MSATEAPAACRVADALGLYVQVNGDDDKESNTINDDDNDDDIVDPVWNYNSGNFSYTALESMTIQNFTTPTHGPTLMINITKAPITSNLLGPDSLIVSPRISPERMTISRPSRRA